MAEAKPLIFVVDDDRGMLRLIEKTLQREGFTTAAAASAREAIEWLQKNQPALMLLDLKLQDVEGKEVINQLATLGLSVPFVVITGQGDERVAVEMMKRGALDYLVKDVQFQEFVPTIVQRSLKQLERERMLAAAEESLRREHEFASAILNTSGALMSVIDREGRFVRFNKACEQLSGYSADEVIGKKAWEILASADEAEAIQKVYQRLFAGEDNIKSESHIIPRRGEPRLIAWSRTALRNREGELEYVIASGIDITERRRLEEEVLRISELEQRRIGQDLHDGLCQHLAGIELMTQALEQNLQKSSRSNAPRAAEIAAQVRESIRQTKQLARGLSPVSLEENGLMSALHELAANITSMFSVNCVFRCDSPILIGDNATATHLFRIAQEAVSNANRHGHAKNIEIILQKTPQRILLVVNDDGKGLPEKSVASHGMGMRIMQYRAGMIRGSFVVQHLKEGGTTVVCSVATPPSASTP
jgi:PAS domain S-box-containing protein